MHKGHEPLASLSAVANRLLRPGAGDPAEDAEEGLPSEPERVRVFTRKHLADFDVKPPERRRLGRGNYVSILKRKKMEASLYEGGIDFDPKTPVGGSIGRMLINKNEDYYMPIAPETDPRLERL